VAGLKPVKTPVTWRTTAVDKPTTSNYQEFDSKRRNTYAYGVDDRVLVNIILWSTLARSSRN
jgi:hypothetical protein